MSDDVTIPREMAAAWAGNLRDIVRGGGDPGLRRLADLLDPPAPSLRDEVASAIAANLPKDRTGLYAADCVLAVVRQRIDGLTLTDWSQAAWGNGWLACHADVLRLLGGES